jgi:hypothetical protein
MVRTAQDAGREPYDRRGENAAGTSGVGDGTAAPAVAEVRARRPGRRAVPGVVFGATRHRLARRRPVSSPPDRSPQPTGRVTRGVRTAKSRPPGGGRPGILDRVPHAEPDLAVATEGHRRPFLAPRGAHVTDHLPPPSDRATGEKYEGPAQGTPLIVAAHRELADAEPEPVRHPRPVLLVAPAQVRNHPVLDVRVALPQGVDQVLDQVVPLPRLERPVAFARLPVAVDRQLAEATPASATGDAENETTGRAGRKASSKAWMQRILFTVGRMSTIRFRGGGGRVKSMCSLLAHSSRKM